MRKPTVITVALSLFLLAAGLADIPNAWAFKEKKVSKMLPPMPKPTYNVGYKWHYIKDGKEEGVDVVVATGNGTVSWRASDCNWIDTDVFAPAQKWDHCKDHSSGTQKVRFMGGRIWPLRVGNKFSYSVKGRYTRGGKGWSGVRECRVKKQVRIETVSGDYDTYKVVCEDPWAIRTWWLSPELQAVVRYRRDRSSKPDHTWEVTKIEWPRPQATQTAAATTTQPVTAKRSPAPATTSLATIAPQTASRTTSYRIGIFPCGGWLSSNHFGDLEPQVARALQTTIEKNRALALAYSYYDNALNEPRIKNQDRLWIGGMVAKKPNAKIVYTLARERGLDGVVMCRGKSRVGGTGTRPALEVYLVDVAQQRVYRKKGTTRESDAEKLARKVLTQFLASRSQVVLAKATPSVTITGTPPPTKKVIPPMVVKTAPPGTKLKLKTIKPEPAVIQKKVEAGDDVVIGTKDGKEFRLQVVQITDTGVAAFVIVADTRVDFDASEGSEAVIGNEEIEIPFDQIATIEREKVVTAWRMDGGRGGAGAGIDAVDTYLWLDDAREAWDACGKPCLFFFILK